MSVQVQINTAINNINAWEKANGDNSDLDTLKQKISDVDPNGGTQSELDLMSLQEKVMEVEENPSSAISSEIASDINGINTWEKAHGDDSNLDKLKQTISQINPNGGAQSSTALLELGWEVQVEESRPRV